MGNNITNITLIIKVMLDRLDRLQMSIQGQFGTETNY